MPAWFPAWLRRGSLLALTAMMALSMLGVHVHHEHGDEAGMHQHHEHDFSHDHDHDHDHDGDAQPDGDRDDDDGIVLHAHAVDAMTMPESPRLAPAASAVTVARHIPQCTPPDGPVVGIDPPPVRPAA